MEEAPVDYARASQDKMLNKYHEWLGRKYDDGGC